MIRASARTDKGVLLVLGITPGNVRRMRAGQPLYVDGEPMGAPGVQVAIVYGETERHIVAELRSQGIELPPDTDESLAGVEDEHRRKGTTP